jgi:hypothetical protein
MKIAGFSLKVWWLVFLSLLNDLYQWIVKHLPYRKRLCWIFGHRYKSVWLKDNDGFLDKSAGEGVLVADTERHGCIYCGQRHKNKWGKNLIDWKRSGYED